MRSRTLLVPYVAVVALVLSGCAGGDHAGDRGESRDPDRFNQLDAGIQAAVDRASELVEPRNVREANEHLGLSGDDPLRYVTYEVLTEGWISCIEDREAGVYRYDDQATAEGQTTYYGDGACSEDPEDAAVIIEGVTVVKGADLHDLGDAGAPQSGAPDAPRRNDARKEVARQQRAWQDRARLDPRDPERFNEFERVVLEALGRASEMHEPTTAEEADTDFGFVGDHPMRHELYEELPDGHVSCIVQRDAGIYRYYDESDLDTSMTYYGHGECSDDPDDATVVVDNYSLTVLKGADLFDQLS